MRFEERTGAVVNRDPRERSDQSLGGTTTGGAGTSGRTSAGAADTFGTAGTASSSTSAMGTGSPGVGEQVQQQAGAAVNQAKEQVGQLKEQMLGQATNQLEGRKDQAAGSLGSVAHAIRQTSQHLRDQDQSAFAGYAERAAEQIENFTGYLGRRDVRQLVGDVERFSRREPALFLGGAFTLGLLAARFLKSSSRPTQETTSREYGQYSQYPGGVPSSARDYGREYGAEGRSSMTSAGEHARYGSGAYGMGTSQSPSSASLVGGSSTADVIVGGPPITTDVIVGGPPLDTPRSGSTMTGETRTGSSSTTTPTGGSTTPGSRSSGDVGS
jgi:hypothetical protein